MSEREGPGKMEADDGRPQVSRSEPQASEDHQVGSEAKRAKPEPAARNLRPTVVGLHLSRAFALAHRSRSGSGLRSASPSLRVGRLSSASLLVV